MTSLPAIPVRSASPCAANRCSACCHDTEMLLTEADVERLRSARPGVDFFFTAEDGFLQLRTSDRAPAMPGAGRPCVFLDDAGRCSAYDARPEGCRLYPAVWDDGFGAGLDDGGCPHTAAFLLDRRTRDAMRGLAARLEDERRRRGAGLAAVGQRG